jgi:molecular chaperone GrpE
LPGNKGGKRVIHRKTAHHHKSDEKDTGHAHKIEVIAEEKDCVAAPVAGAAENGDALSAEELAAQLAEKEKERQELYDRLLRTMAEFDNYKKRVAKDKEDLTRYGNEKLVRELLPVIDNFERALEQAKNSPDQKALQEGVAMILRQLVTLLEKFGVKGFSSVGQPFDPNRHEAMTHQESAAHEENTVIAEFQKGYNLNDRLLRAAMVAVAKRPAEEADASAPDETVH